MGIVSGGGGSGNTTAQVVASGKVLPVADASGVTVDTTTYNNALKGSGKLTTLIWPLNDVSTALALAMQGDAFPRWVLSNDAGDGLYLGDGTYEPTNGNAIIQYFSDGVGAPTSSSEISIARLDLGANANVARNAPRLSQLSPLFSITSGALPTQQLVSGTAAVLASPGTTRDVETHTPVTFNPGVATTATCTVAISPDNVTYSTLAVVTKPVGTVFDGEIDDVTVRLPAGWYIKLTVVNATLGLTTYF